MNGFIKETASYGHIDCIERVLEDIIRITGIYDRQYILCVCSGKTWRGDQKKLQAGHGLLRED